VSSRRGSRPSRYDYSEARVRAGWRGRIIWSAVIVLVAVAIAIALPETARGRDILAAVQRFMLFYSGVLALIALTAAVGAGIVATDRIVMTPGNRVVAQAVHRAVSFGALAFLVTHIVLEILAHRSHVIDAFVPFLANGRRFYIGLGTIASDLVVLLIVTGIARARFAARGRAWTWRVIHATAYLCWPLAIVHGLLAGRHAKPYVDWSYGGCVAAVALALLVRYVATIRSHKEKEAHPLPYHSSSTIQAPVPAMTPHEERWAAVPQTYNLSSAVPTARRTPRALPAGASDTRAAQYSQGTYIAARRLATPRPDVPIPLQHLQNLQQQRTGQWQQAPAAPHPEPQPPDSYPADSSYPGGSAYPGEPDASDPYPGEPDAGDPYDGDSVYPGGSPYPGETDSGGPYADEPYADDSSYPGDARGQVHPGDTGQDYPLGEADLDYPPSEADQDYPPSEADQDYPLGTGGQPLSGHPVYPGSE
jgi:DMSO/TMAO reductase YedYZ heme-binding membrane subunit